MDGLGSRIRAERKAQRLRLQAVAERTGLTPSFLSQVERSRAAPSLMSLSLIARALNVPMPSLMDPPGDGRSVPEASRHGQRPGFGPAPDTLRYERLSTVLPQAGLHALKLKAAPGYRSERIEHDGEEFVFVLSGSIRYVVGDRVHDLGPDDSLHFSSREPHHIENVGAEPAEYISVGTQDLFGDPAAVPPPPLSDTRDP